EQLEHLRGGLAGRADDEDVAEAMLVAEVAVAQHLELGLAGGQRSGLLAGRQVGGRGELLPECVEARADPRMMGEGLAVVVGAHLRPGLVGAGPQVRVAAKRPALEHARDPARRSAAASERLPGLGLAHRVELAGALHRGSCVGRPYTRSRATPPSGKVSSRTWVNGPRSSTRTNSRRSGPSGSSCKIGCQASVAIDEPG